jgi:hypothetical protein
MTDRSTVVQPIEQEGQWFAAAYLIAISPDLQKAVLARRHQSPATGDAVKPMDPTPESLLAANKPFDPAAARKVFETNCMKCHPLSNVEQNPPTTDQEAAELVKRMVSNGLSLPEDELQQITYYLRATYVKR